MNTLQIGGEAMKTLEQANDLVAQLVAENTKLRQDAAKLSDDLDEQKTIAGNWKFRASTALTRLAEFAKLEPVYFSQFSGCGLEEVSKDRYDEIAEDDRITYYVAAGAPPEPADPMDWPLPCDVTVGHGTMQKGVKLRTLVLRMKALYEMATGQDADAVAGRSIEERIAISNAPPLNWAEVGRLIEAADRARAGGLVVGTSNWGAYICRSMGAQPSQAGEVTAEIDTLVKAVWTWGESCGVDGVPFASKGDSHNEWMKSKAEEAKRNLLAAINAKGAA